MSEIMSYAEDPRVVLTLDAGGTNFVFSAVQSDREVVKPITLPSNAHELQACLTTIVEGHGRVFEPAIGEQLLDQFVARVEHVQAVAGVGVGVSFAAWQEHLTLNLQERGSHDEEIAGDFHVDLLHRA